MAHHLRRRRSIPSLSQWSPTGTADDGLYYKESLHSEASHKGAEATFSTVWLLGPVKPICGIRSVAASKPHERYHVDHDLNIAFEVWFGKLTHTHIKNTSRAYEQSPALA